MKELYKINIEGKKIIIIQGDITKEETDAIVNAANSHLQHGGGVAGAIVRAGGRIIQEESNKIGFVPVGNVAVTTGGNLKAKCVIHAVGPRWGEGEEEKKLENAVRNALLKAGELKLKSLSIPAISSGIFGFPKPKCAQILLHTVIEFFKNFPETSIEEVHFTNIDEETSKIFEKTAKES